MTWRPYASTAQLMASLCKGKTCQAFQTCGDLWPRLALWPLHNWKLEQVCPEMR